MRAVDPLAHPEALIRRVYSYVAYRVGPGADAEDITSEAILRAVRYRDSFDRRAGTPTAWVIGIARRCIDDHFAASAGRGVSAPGLEAHESAPDSSDVERETLERVSLSRALAGLRPREVELLALRYGADLSTKQIGELLDLTPAAVDVALHRARERLRTEIEDGASDRTGPVSLPRARRLRPSS